jgi:hypothetical protein
MGWRVRSARAIAMMTHARPPLGTSVICESCSHRSLLSCSVAAIWWDTLAVEESCLHCLAPWCRLIRRRLVATSAEVPLDQQRRNIEIGGVRSCSEEGQMAIARILLRGGLLTLALTSAAVTANAVCRILRTLSPSDAGPTRSERVRRRSASKSRRQSRPPRPAEPRRP